MGGFKNKFLNIEFGKNLYAVIVNALISGCALMVDDCRKSGRKIPNHEELIRNCLLEQYLEDDDVRLALGLNDVPLRFLPEVLDGYNKSAGVYTGRTDIRVTSINWFFNRNDYYIVECKRIDGTQALNKKYVEDGISRFTNNPPKYPSYHQRNIMLAFMVKSVDRNTVISAIAKIHATFLNSITTQNIAVSRASPEYSLCESGYSSGLTLGHIFYDVSDAVVP